MMYLARPVASSVTHTNGHFACPYFFACLVSELSADWTVRNEPKVLERRDRNPFIAVFREHHQEPPRVGHHHRPDGPPDIVAPHRGRSGGRRRRRFLGHDDWQPRLRLHQRREVLKHLGVVALWNVEWYVRGHANLHSLIGDLLPNYMTIILEYQVGPGEPFSTYGRPPWGSRWEKNSQVAPVPPRRKPRSAVQAAEPSWRNSSSANDRRRAGPSSKNPSGGGCWKKSG